MLHVLTLCEADALLAAMFTRQTAAEQVPLDQAAGRTLRRPLCAKEDLPAFTRSAVDGYAVRAADTFGCSESMPALLTLCGAVEMGSAPDFALAPLACAYVPTGGALPDGADAVVMIEYAERFGGEIAIGRPAAPGLHAVARGGDLHAGQTAIPYGRVLDARAIGTAASLGYDTLTVAKKPRVIVFSTGDELMQPDETPSAGQVRDCNGPMLCAAMRAYGAETEYGGVVADDEDALLAALDAAAGRAELVLLSGGSSAGEKDASARVLNRLGRVLFHGLALKPGKPTLAADVRGVPVIGLPGHPAAAYLVARLLVRGLIGRMLGAQQNPHTARCVLTEAIPSNHGREEAALLRIAGATAAPLPTQSGLMHALTQSDGYTLIPRDCEGRQKGETVEAIYWEEA